MINNPKLQIIAERYKKTPAQVLIRWSMQKGNIEIPKSSNKDRIEQNFRIIDFTLNEINGGSYRIYCRKFKKGSIKLRNENILQLMEMITILRMELL